MSTYIVRIDNNNIYIPDEEVFWHYLKYDYGTDHIKYYQVNDLTKSLDNFKYKELKSTKDCGMELKPRSYFMDLLQSLEKHGNVEIIYNGEITFKPIKSKI